MDPERLSYMNIRSVSSQIASFANLDVSITFSWLGWDINLTTPLSLNSTTLSPSHSVLRLALHFTVLWRPAGGPPSASQSKTSRPLIHIQLSSIASCYLACQLLSEGTTTFFFASPNAMADAVNATRSRGGGGNPQSGAQMNQAHIPRRGCQT
jgi:hypothetical protein